MARALVFCLDLFAVASRLKISYDSTTDIVRFYARCRKRYRTRYRTILRKISYDLRRCTAIVRLDIVHIPYRYSTDIVPILRYPHLKGDAAKIFLNMGTKIESNTVVPFFRNNNLSASSCSLF